LESDDFDHLLKMIYISGKRRAISLEFCWLPEFHLVFLSKQFEFIV